MSVSIVAIQKAYEKSKVSLLSCTIRMDFSKGEFAGNTFKLKIKILDDCGIIGDISSIVVIAPRKRFATQDERKYIMSELKIWERKLKNEREDETQYHDIQTMLERVGIQLLNKKTNRGRMFNVEKITKFSATRGALTVTFSERSGENTIIKLSGELLADGKFWVSEGEPFFMTHPQKKKLSKKDCAQIVAEIQKSSSQVVFDRPNVSKKENIR